MLEAICRLSAEGAGAHSNIRYNWRKKSSNRSYPSSQTDMFLASPHPHRAPLAPGAANMGLESTYLLLELLLSSRLQASCYILALLVADVLRPSWLREFLSMGIFRD